MQILDTNLVFNVQSPKFLYSSHINMDKVKSIYTQMRPLTLPYKDQKGLTVQLWKAPIYGLLGSIIDEGGRLKIISGNRIINPLSPAQKSDQLASSLESSALKCWDLLFDPLKAEISIWPHLIAAGRVPKYNGIGADGKSWYQQKIDETKKVLTDKRGHLDPARRELRGEVIKINPKDNKPYEHYREVNDMQQSLKNIIGQIKRELRNDKLDPADKERFERELAEASKLLDYSEGFVPSKWLKKSPNDGNNLKNPADKDFEECVQQTNLTESYKATHPNNPIQPRGVTAGQIGGVACSMDYIEGLFDLPESLFENEHFFCLPNLPNGELPFSNEELKQILRELAIGIYTHSTVPFFSLHFKQETADLFPVIHPAYKDTLVGRVIALLDYFMKGYLNGGVYDEEFIDQWAKDPNWNNKSKSALQHLINFREYCNLKLEGKDKEYDSIDGISKIFEEPEILELIPRKKPKKIISDFKGFRNSFRIIAKQNSFRKSENMFIIDSDFDVLYTIEPSPEYKEALDLCLRKGKGYPQSYISLLASYDEIAKRIHDHMTKMPFCRPYFAMLGIINFFSSYFSSLKKHRKVPVLPSMGLNTKLMKECPSLFPHLPILKMRKKEIEINLAKFYESIFKNIKKDFAEYLENGNKKSELLDIIYQGLRNNLLPQNDQDLNNLIKSKMYDYEPKLRNFAEGFLEVWKRDFRELYPDLQRLKMKTTNFYYKPTEVDLFLDLIMKVKPLVSSINLGEVSYDQHNTGRSLTNWFYFEKKSKVVGGCGMSLSKEKLQTSDLAETILSQNWNYLQDLPFESWAKVNVNGNEGAVFRLMTEDLPSNTPDQYDWMEAQLFIPQGMNLEKLQRKIEIEDAMVSIDKSNFDNLIQSTSHLEQLIDRHGRSLMHRAASLKEAYYIKFLANKGLSTECEDNYGYRPIHYAAMSGSLEVLEFLIKKNRTNLNAKSKNNSTPLVVAIQHKQLEVVKKLISYQPKLSLLTRGYTELHSALHQGNREIIFELLNYKTLVANCLNVCAEEGGTPLMLACELDDLEIVEILIKKGANADIKRRDGVTVVEIAIRKNRISILKLLLQKTNPSSMALEAAAQLGSLEVFQLLDYYDFFSDYENAAHDTPLHIALRHGNVPVAMYLSKKRNIAMNPNLEEETPFDLALKMGLWDVALGLYNQNAIVNYETLFKVPYQPLTKKILSQTKLTPELLDQYLMMAAKAGNHQALMVLDPKGQRLESVAGPNGWKIIHYLAKGDGLFHFKGMVLKNPNLLNSFAENKSPAYIAAESGSSDVLRFLLDYMKKKMHSLENHFGKRHLFYGILESNSPENIKHALDIFGSSNIINAPLDEFGTTLSHSAAMKGLKNILEFLCENGADFNIKDKRNLTPLFYAVRLQDKNCVEYLIKKKVEIDGAALYEAAKKVDLDIFKVLLSILNNPRNLDEALYLAVSNRHSNAFINLTKAGATFNYRTIDGSSPLLVASKLGYHEFLAPMLKINSFEDHFYNGNNALHLACINKQIYCVKLLLDAGYRSDLPNSDGKTPMDLAAKHKGILLLLENEDTQVFDEFKKGLMPKSVGAILHVFHKFPLNELIFINSEHLVLVATPLQILLELSKVKPDLQHFVDERLLDPSLDPNIQDGGGETIAHKILKRGICPVEIYKINWKIKDKNGRTPLHNAAEYASPSLFLRILSELSKEDIEIEDNFGQNVLFAVLREKDSSQSVEKLKHLLRFGIDLNCHDYRLMTPLGLTCDNGNFTICKFLVNHGADVNKTVTSKHLLPLNFAIEKKHTEITRLLISHGANCQIKDYKGKYPIHIATAVGNNELFRLLLSKGVSVDVKDDRGLEPVHFAAQHDQVELLDTISTFDASRVNSGEDKGTAPLNRAALSGSVNAFEWLLKNKARVEKFDRTDLGVMSSAAIGPAFNAIMGLLEPYRISQNPETILKATERAIRFDNLDAIKTLYRMLPSPNSLIEGQSNGLHLASKHGAIQCTGWLLQNGGDPMIEDGSRRTAFELAASNKSYEQFKLLVDYANPELEKVNSLGQTLLHIASQSGNLKHVMLLILKGISLDSMDQNGNTSLHLATDFKNYDVIKMLLACGANPSLKNFNGSFARDLLSSDETNLIELFDEFRLLERREDETLLHKAIRAQYPLAVSLLTQISDVDEQDSFGTAPLHLAVGKGQFKIATILLKADADIDIRDNNGRTPLWYACIYGQNAELVKLLIEAGADISIKDNLNRTILEHVELSNSPNKNQILEFFKVKK